MFKGKIKKKFIGTKVFHPIVNKYFLIEEGKEEYYNKLGLDIFIQPRKPKLIKDDKVKKGRHNKLRNDSNGNNDNK